MSIAYRREIDGLRAVAVLPVIFYHANIAGMGGGFVGVDVFFVISGYLITSILLCDIEDGRFSVLRFYERRVRRIIPALFIVLLATLVTGYVLMLPYELKSLGRTLASVIVFASNILFWRESGYFAAASEVNPLIHTWSLAIEEQFYIFFPLLLWLLSRFGRRILWVAFIFAFILSLTLAQIASTKWVSANFFLLPTRGWELLAGGMAALWLQRRPAPQGFVAETLGAGGLAAIGLSVLLYNSSTPYPSLWTALPVLGAVGVIVGAGPHSVAGRLLSWRGFVGIGLISYSLYLWHQPLFAFARLQNVENKLSPGQAATLIAFAFVLSWASLKFVEQPFRRSGLVTRGGAFAFAGFGSVGLMALALTAVASQGLLYKYPSSQRQWIADSPFELGAYVRGEYRKHLNSPLSNNANNLVIVGDSYSQDLFNMIHENNAFHDYHITTIYIPKRCQIYYGITQSEAFKYISTKDHDGCSKAQLTDQALNLMRHADVVFFAAAWEPWAAERFKQSMVAMELPSKVKVYVLGRKGFDMNRRTLLKYSPEQAPMIRMPVRSELVKVDAIMKRQLPPENYVDTLAVLCGGGCPIFTPNGELISYDGGHLTKAGATYIGRLLFSLPSLAPFVGATSLQSKSPPAMYPLHGEAT